MLRDAPTFDDLWKLSEFNGAGGGRYKYLDDTIRRVVKHLSV